jgi:hypothetical protein
LHRRHLDGDEYPQRVFNDALYEIYFRFLETDDEYFDYATAKVPPQGRRRISGINLPESILRKVYYDSARTAPPRIELMVDLNNGGCTLMFIEA